MKNNEIMTKNQQRLDLLAEIEQTPDKYIPELLKIVQLIRGKNIIGEPTSVTAWDNAMNQINHRKNQPDPEQIARLCKFFYELDDETEQKETLQIIQSLEAVSI